MSGLYTVTANTGETLAEARDARATHQRAVASSAVEIASASWNQTTTNLTITVTNTGERTVDVDKLDVLVDGRYRPLTAFNRTVEGTATDIWRPDERLVLETGSDLTTAPDRVKVVTANGLADTAEVVA